MEPNSERWLTRHAAAVKDWWWKKILRAVFRFKARHLHVETGIVYGRANDQVQRNHSTQYISYPDFPWQRLRKDDPGKYESYVDLEPGVWMKIRIMASGATAKLYVNGATQPTLLVNDLKLGDSEGGVALWLGPEAEGYFANLKVSAN